MKFFVVILISVVILKVCRCYPQNYPQNIGQDRKNYSQSKIVRHENNIGVGNYNFAYETSDGSLREEKAELKNAGSKNEAFTVHGSYTFVGTDGKTYKVTYVADENGYRATGEHLPKNQAPN